MTTKGWAARLAAIAASSAVALFLAWQIVASTASSLAQATAPETALGWRADNARALSVLAEQALARGAQEKAVGYARRALAEASIETAAYRVMGQAEAANGDLAAAGRLMAHAGTLTRRDPGVSFWLYREELLAGRYQAAFEQADALMRRAPRAAPLLTRELVASIADPRAISPLVRRLAASPPWRTPFMNELARSAPAPILALDLLYELADTDAPPKTRELSPLLSRMAARGDHLAAYEAWRSFLPPPAPVRGEVYDGGFGRPAGPEPFGWDVNAEAATLAPDEGAGLQVRRAGFKDAVAARQLLLLEPGRHRLSTRAALVEGERMMMEWRLTCDRRKPLITLPVMVDSMKGSAASEFVVPEDDCPAQRLSLVVKGEDTHAPAMARVAEVQIATVESP